jgi:phage repressor protein C with HTH and peptisase S24 domain
MRDKLLKEIDRRAKILGLSDIALAKKANLNRDSVRDIRRGKTTNPSYAVVTALARALGCTAADLTGEQLTTPIRDRESNSVTVFEVPTYAQSGHGGIGDIEITRDMAVGEYSFPAAGFRQRFGAPPTAVFIDEVRGDSNVPTLNPGEPVMIDSGDRRPSPPGFFLLWDGIGMVLKRVEFVPNSDPPKVLLKSDNPRYESYERLLDEVQIYGRMLGRWQRF